MFEGEKTESFFRRVVSALAVLPRRYTAVLLGAIVLLLPYSTTILPEWRLRVVDETGNPFAGARVRQEWHHYYYDVSDGDDRTADENGYVVFPARTFTAPLLYRVLRSGLAHVLTLAHGSTGIRASVWAISSQRVSKFIDYKPGESLAKEIILPR